ncbi:MAG: hypothetical protein J6I74_06340, partial [Schwartzia sp.]|nr:hypothetical protein [Schwartzia sp. (in: firmicutes)]
KEELFNLGYFREEKGNLVTISEYFTDFLSNEKLQIDIWDNVINLEKKLKQVIEREFPKMVDHFEAGGKNTNEIQKNILRRVDHSAIPRYETFIANNKKTFHKDSTYFDVMSLADAVKIIRNCWEDIFSPYFDNNPYSEWDHKLSKCAWARNPIAHGHEEYLTDADKKEIDAYCKMTFDVLTKTIGSIRADHRSFLNVAKKYNDMTKNDSTTSKQTELAPHIRNNTPNGSLVGKRTEMEIFQKGSNRNLSGIVEGKYTAVIPKNYLLGKELESLLGKRIPVEIEKMNNGKYEARPIWRDIHNE